MRKNIPQKPRVLGVDPDAAPFSSFGGAVAGVARPPDLGGAITNTVSRCCSLSSPPALLISLYSTSVCSTNRLSLSGLRKHVRAHTAPPSQSLVRSLHAEHLPIWPRAMEGPARSVSALHRIVRSPLSKPPHRLALQAPRKLTRRRDWGGGGEEGLCVSASSSPSTPATHDQL
ncbi:unnamed protein product [Pleuronectes platessa]|uniref:Uncharacterized protein n=1 Tax=Pleuronectes platessa TaxID=8262 RepID=A0A9N7Z308_PLEPL|nr:unnamed protein product [Pleuronectes platessa]